VGIAVKPSYIVNGEVVWRQEALVAFVIITTIIVGIWHEDDWMKRDLAQPIYIWVETFSAILCWIFH